MAGPGPSSKVSATVRPPEAVEPITVPAPGCGGGAAGVDGAAVGAVEVFEVAGVPGAVGAGEAVAADGLGVGLGGAAEVEGAAGEPAPPGGTASEPGTGATVVAAVPLGRAAAGDGVPDGAAALGDRSAPSAVPHAASPRAATTATVPASSRRRDRDDRDGAQGRRAVRCMAAAPEVRVRCRSLGSG
nr:hypothetical protein KitaXyl93_17740 [Kitasatospora sp. Xyl93]